MDEHPDCVMVGSRVVIIDPEGDDLTVMKTALEHEQIVSDLLRHSGQIVYHPSVVYLRDVVLEMGGYRPEYYTAEDLHLYLQLAERGLSLISTFSSTASLRRAAS